MLGRHTCLAAGTCAFVNFKKLDSSNNTLNITQLKLEKYRHLTFADCREFLFYWSASSIRFGLRWWLFFGRLWAHVVLVGRICCHRRRRRRRRLHLSIKHCPSFFMSTCEKNNVKVTLSHSTLLRQKSLGLALAVYFSKRQGLAKRAFKKFPKFLNMEE